MAKRYIKIGWENKPSVKTPANMANLGRMDKGIDDCDNAIEEIYAKRVNNVVTTNEDTFLAGPVGKVLQDQVTELNKNLLKFYKVYNYAGSGAGILTNAGKFIGVTDGKVSYVYLITITDSAGDYYCGIHFYRPTISHAIVKLGGGLDVVINNQGTVSPTNGTASYEFAACLLSAK